MREGGADLLKGIVAGAGGGLIATVVMTGLQMAYAKASEAAGKKPQLQGQDEGEPATVQAAQKVSQGVAGHELEGKEKNVAGQAVHYGFGTANGALYGAMAEVMPAARTGLGTIFGAGLWAMADEVAVPGLGWSKKPSEYPMSTHVYGLVAHLVYGATLDVVSRRIRERL